jgi:hypothetical protein
MHLKHENRLRLELEPLVWSHHVGMELTKLDRDVHDGGEDACIDAVHRVEPRKLGIGEALWDDDDGDDGGGEEVATEALAPVVEGEPAEDEGDRGARAQGPAAAAAEMEGILKEQLQRRGTVAVLRPVVAPVLVIPGDEPAVCARALAAALFTAAATTAAGAAGGRGNGRSLGG